MRPSTPSRRTRRRSKPMTGIQQGPGVSRADEREARSIAGRLQEPHVVAHPRPAAKPTAKCFEMPGGGTDLDSALKRFGPLTPLARWPSSPSALDSHTPTG